MPYQLDEVKRRKTGEKKNGNTTSSAAREAEKKRNLRGQGGEQDRQCKTPDIISNSQSSDSTT